MIREKIFIYFRQELPYTAGVEVETIEDKSDLFSLKAKILVLSNKYKGMIIGKQANNLKHIGIMVRKELETITNKKVFVGLTVEVDKHWPERLLV